MIVRDRHGRVGMKKNGRHGLHGAQAANGSNAREFIFKQTGRAYEPGSRSSWDARKIRSCEAIKELLWTKCGKSC